MTSVCGGRTTRGCAAGQVGASQVWVQENARVCIGGKAQPPSPPSPPPTSGRVSCCTLSCVAVAVKEGWLGRVTGEKGGRHLSKHPDITHTLPLCRCVPSPPIECVHAPLYSFITYCIHVCGVGRVERRRGGRCGGASHASLHQLPALQVVDHRPRFATCQSLHSLLCVVM